MKNQVFVVVVLLIVVVVVAFFRDWSRLSANNAAQQSSDTLTVEKSKIHADEQKVKDKVQSLGQDARVKAGDRANQAKEPVGVNHEERNN